MLTKKENRTISKCHKFYRQQNIQYFVRQKEKMKIKEITNDSDNDDNDDDDTNDSYNDDGDSNEYIDIDDDDVVGKIQLGFCEEIISNEQYSYVGHRTYDSNQWDGGQLGGTPSWLNPIINIQQPSQSQSQSQSSSVSVESNVSSLSHKSSNVLSNNNNVQCTICNTTMNFLCQLYTPIDTVEVSTTSNNNSTSTDFGQMDRAYHRTLYVFICPNHNNTTNDDNVLHTPETCVRILRTQLSKINPYWPSSSSAAAAAATTTNTNNNNNNKTNTSSAIQVVQQQQQQQQTPNLCRVCNFPSIGKCPLQQQYFCSKLHQILYKKFIYNDTTCTTNTVTRTSSSTTSNSLINNTIIASDNTTNGTAVTTAMVSTSSTCQQQQKQEQQRQQEHTVACTTKSIFEIECLISNRIPNIYPLSEIVVENEPEPITYDNNSKDKNKYEQYDTMFPNNKNHSKKINLNNMKNEQQCNKVEDDESDSDSDDDSDIDLEQDDLNNIVQGNTTSTTKKKNNKNNKIDPFYDNFIDRVITSRSNVQNQIIRYNRWPYKVVLDNSNNDDTNDDNNDTNDDDGDESSYGPLWVHSQDRPTTRTTIQHQENRTDNNNNINITSEVDDVRTDNDTTAATSNSNINTIIPLCPNCGSIRKFEFQIMPQMIHYLKQKKKVEATSTTTTTTTQQEQEANSIVDNTDITSDVSTISTKQGSTTSTSTGNNSNNVITKEMICAMEQAEEYIRTVPNELIPPCLIDAKENAILNVHKKLFDNTTTGSTTNNNDPLNWGTIAVYTCTNSCNPKQPTTTTKMITNIADESDDINTCSSNNPNVGVTYLEEYGWLQRSID